MNKNLFSLAFFASVTISFPATVSAASVLEVKPVDADLIKPAIPPNLLERNISKIKKGVVAAEPALYLIRLSDAPVALYGGEIPSFAATNPEVTNAPKLDTESKPVKSYLHYLQGRHNQVRQAIGGKVVFDYFYASNGMAVVMTPEQAEKARSLPGVVSVKRDFKRQLHTDAGPAWIGADQVWSGGVTPRTMGEGVVVGIIDSGINPSNPSFADVGGDGYDHTNPKGKLYGVCDPAMVPGPAVAPYDATFPCNDKLIGAWGFQFTDLNGVPVANLSPVDDDGHGSHTASTAAGNQVDAEIVAPTITVDAAISGVAPHANIIAYDVCDSSGCTGAAIAAAIDQSIADGVDVINFSIGSRSPSNLWVDSDTLGFLSARAAGIFVAASAGNAGPGANTVGSPADAPWLTAVAAATHDRGYVNALQAFSGGDTTPSKMSGRSLTSAYGPAPIVHARDFDGIADGDADDGQCLTPFAAATWSNQIVVCDRGGIARTDKSANVAAGGAAGFVLANVDAQAEHMVADPHTIPAVHIGDTAGDILRGWLATGSGHSVMIEGTSTELDTETGNTMADFSSRGANRALPGIVKPDIAAPGVDIVAAHGVDDEVVWGTISGTSMASPHIAGAGALLSFLHPDWTPAEMQSALMMSANTKMLKEDAATPADAFDMGSGMVDLSGLAYGAIGLVMDETTVRYNAANPDVGGNPLDLNIPSMGSNLCAGSCSWTRTVRSVAPSTIDWTAAVTPPTGWQIAVSPQQFSLMPDGTQELTITAKLTDLAEIHGWNLGEVRLLPGSNAVPAHLPVAVTFQPQKKPSGSYVMTNSVDDTSCAMPDVGQGGGYIDLEGLSINAIPALSGNEGAWSLVGVSTTYYGIDTSFGFTTNGLAIFDVANNYNPAGDWKNQNLPDPNTPNALAAALWSDLNIVYDAGANAGISLANLGTGYLIEYDDAQKFGDAASLGDFEMYISFAIDPAGPEIVYAYSNIAALPANATVGVESQSGTLATAFLNQADPAGTVVDGLMVCYDYQEDPGFCQDYTILSGETVVESQSAAVGILAGNGTVIGASGVAFNTAAGGTVHVLPGFSVPDGMVWSVDTSGASACPI